MTGFGALLQLTLALSAGEASLRIAPGVPCVSESGLTKLLEAAGITLRAGAWPRVDVHASDGKLELRVIYATQQVLERRIPAASCEGVERIAATLITTWIESQPRAVPAPAAAPPPRPAPLLPANTQGEAARPTEPAQPTRATPAITLPQRPAVAQIERPAVPAGVGEPPPSSRVRDTVAGPVVLDAGVAPAPIVANPLPAPDAAVTVPEAALLDAGVGPSPIAANGPTALNSNLAAPDAGSSGWTLRIAVLGGVAGGQTPRAVAAGAALIEVGGANFSVGLEAGLETAHTTAVDAGKISAEHHWLGVYGGARYRLGRIWLEAAVGVRGWRIATAASGFVDNRQAVLLGAGPMLALGASLHLAGPFALVLRTTGSVRLPEERLRVDPSGKVVVLRIWEAGALVGLSAQIP